MKTYVALAASALIAMNSASARKEFLEKLPAAFKLTQDIGHVNGDSTTLTAFGEAFEKAGSTWSNAFCKAMFPGASMTNGEAFGDPCCTWKKGGVPDFQVKPFTTKPVEQTVCTNKKTDDEGDASKIENASQLDIFTENGGGDGEKDTTTTKSEFGKDTLTESDNASTESESGKDTLTESDNASTESESPTVSGNASTEIESPTESDNASTESESGKDTLTESDNASTESESGKDTLTENDNASTESESGKDTPTVSENASIESESGKNTQRGGETENETDGLSGLSLLTETPSDSKSMYSGGAKDDSSASSSGHGCAAKGARKLRH